MGIKQKIADKIYECEPDHIFIPLHLPGVLSYQASCFCSENNIPFTGFYFLRYPDTWKMMARVWPFNSISFSLCRYWTHNFLSDATNVLVPTRSMRDELIAEGCKDVYTWPHGVNLSRFTLPTAQEKVAARKRCKLDGYKRPLYLFVGRLCLQKNIPALLNVKVPGTKVVVGPAEDFFSLGKLRKQYPDIVFVGGKYGQELLDYYRSADVFLFPSKFDSFGIVLLEALATGLPIVGFNAFGPSDVVPNGCGVSYLADNDQEFQACAEQAARDLKDGKVTPLMCRDHAAKFSWEAAIDILESRLVPIDKEKMLERMEDNMLSSYCGCC